MPKTICLMTLVVIFSTTVAYVMTRDSGVHPPGNSPQNSNHSVGLTRAKVKRNLLPNQLRWALNELGDRLERPGKERRTMQAELQRTPGARPVQIVSEFPDRLRFMVQDGLSTRVVTFDGNETKALGVPPDSQERDLIESLVYDTPEHFFISHSRGVAIRSLGNRFRADDGIYYDVYELTDVVQINSVPRVQSKRYYFNSDTQLLEKVQYAIDRNGVKVQVETRSGNWEKSDQQRYPAEISRLEKGHAVWTLSVKSSVAGPMLGDGIFSTP